MKLAAIRMHHLTISVLRHRVLRRRRQHQHHRDLLMHRGAMRHSQSAMMSSMHHHRLHGRHARQVIHAPRRRHHRLMMMLRIYHSKRCRSYGTQSGDDYYGNHPRFDVVAVIQRGRRTRPINRAIRQRAHHDERRSKCGLHLLHRGRPNRPGDASGVNIRYSPTSEYALR